ncbi:MAG TPA: MBL fold metallo-hydrolase [Patescibacteria group bacterium]|nr:MBL fold metallo-hydrolase [Patescibacteria group bacterium]
MPEVAPRIRRLGDEIVNSYLVEDGGALTVVDAGAPGYWAALLDELAAIGRTLLDVRAIVLTHGHDDHIGFAERARQAGIGSRVHPLDATLARKEIGNPARLAGGLRIGPSIGFLWFSLRHGMLRTPGLGQVETFDAGATLDVPGAPLVIHTPGHTPGSVALHFAGHDTLFVGDALNTYSVATGWHGPQLSPFNADRAQALDSLARLEAVEATNVLPGHGAAWRQGVRDAVKEARRISLT